MEAQVSKLETKEELSPLTITTDEHITNTEDENLKPILSYTTKYTTHHFNQGDYYYDSKCDRVLSCKI
jgi:hypothetical protein